MTGDISPYTRVPEEKVTVEEDEEDEERVYETKEDGSVLGIPTATRVQVE